MTDAERVLHILLHDLRTPIGVAQGYLRMMQEGRLTAAAETERAVTKALSALGQTARLCQDAGDFLDNSRDRVRSTTIDATALVAELGRLASNRSVQVTSHQIPAHARLTIAGETEDVAAAILQVLLTTAGRQVIQADVDADSLRFHTDAGNTDLVLTPFDPWSIGLPVAAASRRIAWSSGQIQKVGTGNGLIVTLPLKHVTPQTA